MAEEHTSVLAHVASAGASTITVASILPVDDEESGLASAGPAPLPADAQPAAVAKTHAANVAVRPMAGPYHRQARTQITISPGTSVPSRVTQLSQLVSL